MKKLLLIGAVLLVADVYLFTVILSRRSTDSEATEAIVTDDPSVSSEREASAGSDASSGLRLRWDAVQNPKVLEYRIYVTQESGSYAFEEPTATVSANETEWAIESLPSGVYFAVVTAATLTEESPPTAEIAFTVP